MVEDACEVARDQILKGWVAVMTSDNYSVDTRLSCTGRIRLSWKQYCANVNFYRTQVNHYGSEGVDYSILFCHALDDDHISCWVVLSSKDLVLYSH